MQRPVSCQAQVFSHCVLDQLGDMKFADVAAIGFGGVRETLAHTRTNRDRNIAPLGKRSAQTQILQAKVQREGRVVVTGKDGWGVMTGDKAVPDTVLDRVPKNVQRNACPLAQHKPFADHSRMREPEVIGHQLHGVAGAEFTATDHPAHPRQDRLAHIQRGIVAASEQRQPPPACTINGAGHRRINRFHAHPSGLLCQLDDKPRIIGGGVDPDRAFAEPFENAILAAHDAIDDIRLRQRRNEDINVARAICRRFGPCGPAFDMLCRAGLVDVVHFQLKARAQQHHSHVGAHVSETDKSNTHDSPFLNARPTSLARRRIDGL